jgi:hypothetical protein
MSFHPELHSIPRLRSNAVDTHASDDSAPGPVPPTKSIGLDFPSRPSLRKALGMREWHVVGLCFSREMLECLFDAWKASITAAYASSHVAHLDGTARGLP